MLAGRGRAVISLTLVGVAFGFALVLVTAPGAVAQSQSRPWKLPRTAWGDPDFQGVTWDFSTMTPLERPTGVETSVFTEAEAAAFEPSTLERQKAGNTNGPDWWDEGSRHLDRRRTSLIINPESGRLPPLTPDGAARAATARRVSGRPAEGPEDFPPNTRCIGFQSAGPPMIPAPYNDHVQFFQTRDLIALLNENIHDVRIVPIDGRPHGPIRQWMGDGRGRWDGDTLVVETTHFSSTVSVRGSGENLHVVERFKRIDANTIDYQFTADDPTVWTRPWTAALLMHGTNHATYEFACHEGNTRSMEGLLRGARTMDQAPTDAPR